jgi:predicted transcriptional regulator
MEDKAMSSSAIATLVKIMESLPPTMQDIVVEHLKEYIRKSNITVAVSPDGKLEIPAEIESQLKSGDKYTVTVTEDSMVFQKVKIDFDWEELRRRRESLPPDTNPMTIEEICEIVREVRHEKKSEIESQL